MIDLLLFVLLGLAGLAIFVALFVGVISLADRWKRRRSEAVRPVAEELGLTFTAEPEIAEVERFGEFELFAEGIQWVENLMRGPRGEAEVWIFDEFHSTSNPKNRYCQTVVACESESLDLPRFVLKPKIERYRRGIFAGVHFDVKALLGFSGIDLDEHPEFSRRYHLAGEDEKAVRKVFSPAVVARFEELEPVRAEGNGRKLLVYRPAWEYLEPNRIAPLLREALTLLAALRGG